MANKEARYLNGENSDRIDLEVFLSLVFIGKHIIIGAVIITVAAALIFSLIMPKKYQSTAKILAEPQKEENPYYIEASSDKERRMFLETQKEIMNSDTVIRKTLAGLQGMKAEQIEPQVIENFRKKITISSRSGMGKSVITGTGIGESNTFFVTVKENSPEKAMKAVNSLVENYMEEASRVRSDQAKTAMKILERAVAESRKWAQKTHQELAEFEAETGGLLFELVNIYKPTIRVFPELPELRRLYEEARAEIEKKKSLVGALEKAVGEEDDSAIPPEFLASHQSIRLMKDKIAELELEMNEKIPFYKEQSREIQSYVQQIKSAEENMKKQITDIIRSEKKSLEAMISAQTEREKSLADYEKKMERLSILNSKHAELRREYQGAGKALDAQIQSLAETRISAAQNVSGLANIAVIDHGILHKKAVSPRIRRNLILSIIIGLGLGILIVLFEQLAHPVFVHPRQIERVTSVPVVATLYKLDSEVDNT